MSATPSRKRKSMSGCSEFFEQFGDTLVSPSTGRTVSPADALMGKTVMVYISAYWCPPCRRFTPLLINLYNQVKSKPDSNVELVFVSLDHSELEYNAYVKKMPWLVTPFEFKGGREMAKKYKAGGIPHLVVVDEYGEVITTEGTAEAQLDGQGKNFPWRPKTFSEIWPKEVLSKSEKIPSSTFDDKYLLIYFSAQWCPPCRGFTPILSEAYTKLKEERGDDFEVVFVSSDRDEDAFNQYHEDMTFCAIPFENREASRALTKHFGITGIPKLLILGPVETGGERPIINDNIRMLIERGDFSDFPFHKRNYADLTTGGEDINEKTCLMVFYENGDDDEKAKIIDAVKNAARLFERKKEWKFYWATEAKGMAMRVKECLKLEKVSNEPVMVVLNLADKGSYYISDQKDITVQNIMSFIMGKRERRQLT